MHISPKRFLFTGLVAMLILIAFACNTTWIVRDPVPEVKIPRSQFVYTNMQYAGDNVPEGARTTIWHFVNIYNQNQVDDSLKIKENYTVTYDEKERSYHVQDGVVDIIVKLEDKGVAYAGIKEQTNIDIEEWAKRTSALVKQFTGDGYIPAAVVADMSKIRSKAEAMGKAGLSAFSEMDNALKSMNQDLVVDTLPNIGRQSLPYIEGSDDPAFNFNVGEELKLPENNHVIGFTAMPTLEAMSPMDTNMPELTFPDIKTPEPLDHFPFVTPAPTHKYAPYSLTPSSNHSSDQKLTEAERRWQEAKSGLAAQRDQAAKMTPPPCGTPRPLESTGYELPDIGTLKGDVGKYQNQSGSGTP